MAKVTEMNVELLPCPFCGGKADIFVTATKYAVECDNAACIVNPDALATFKHEAIAAWNRRAAQPADVEAGGLPPLPEPDHSLDGGTLHFYTAEQVEQIRREAVGADRRARSNSPEFDGIKTQPASAAQGVKTWQERCDWMSDEPATKLMVEAMKAEIYDLRAQLASEQQAKKGSGE